MSTKVAGISRGLEGVVAAETALSRVDGEAGSLTIAGFDVAELAPNARFEETALLLWSGEFPDGDATAAFTRALAARRALPEAALPLLRASRDADPMDALRLVLGTVSLLPRTAAGLRLDAAPADVADGLALLAVAPTIVAAHARLARGEEPLAPRGDLGHAANFLWMLTGEEPDPARVRALETYLNTVVDHGLNASTFTARVIASTGSDLVSAVVGAAGALKGPLHGGAPGPALDMVFEIGNVARAEEVLREKLTRGERLMGFGHRVYKVRDPRADVLAVAAERLFASGGDRDLYALARGVEREALRLLEEHKPGRRLQTNVEFYTALVLHGIGLPAALFTPVFAMSRIAGWIAHALEQRRANRLIRPQSVYVGPEGRTLHATVSS